MYLFFFLSKVQVEEYKQLKESMNQGQDPHVVPQQPQLAAAQDPVPPHQENQEKDSMVVLK